MNKQSHLKELGKTRKPAAALGTSERKHSSRRKTQEQNGVTSDLFSAEINRHEGSNLRLGLSESPKNSLIFNRRPVRKSDLELASYSTDDLQPFWGGSIYRHHYYRIVNKHLPYAEPVPNT